MEQQSLFDDHETTGTTGTTRTTGTMGATGTEFAAVDQDVRDFAVDPANDVVLEASAGTGKTRVLVDRYVRLIEKGVEPRHILAMTFTRKAAAEMRERVLKSLRARAEAGAIQPKRWADLRQRISEIQISTIDAFCFGLLREFPLEAGVEPGFDIADETEMGRFAREALDRTLHIARGLLPEDESLRLLFTRVKGNVLRGAVEEMLDRRHVALPAVRSFVKRSQAGTAAAAADRFLDQLRSILRGSTHRTGFLDRGPDAPEFNWLRADLTALDELSGSASMPRIQQLRHRLERYFLTGKGTPRLKTPFKIPQFRDRAAKDTHEAALIALAPSIKDALDELETAVNALLAKGLRRLLQIACRVYESLLEEHALLDFAGMLDRAVTLLSRQEEFARSRLKLQARYHHVLVDEFQDTSRLQWRLIELLVEAWGEGEGIAEAPTSIFIVGDRKQSIYRFRHAEVTLLDEAARKISLLRPERPVRQAITASFRAVPELLAFTNALAESVQSTGDLPERFTYTDSDRFASVQVAPGALRDGHPVLGLIAEETMAACAEAVAAEVHRLVGHAIVRDRHGPPRPARPDDIAILFRARAGHQLFESALESRNLRTYVYKGLGFFDAPEVQDLQALLRVLAQPDSNLRAAEILRSRFVRVSDDGLARLAPAFSDALFAPEPAGLEALDDLDRRLVERARRDLPRWVALADRLPPSEVLDTVLNESGFAFEMRGRRLDQARENVKKVRSLIRRVESRGYATLGRIAEYFETLRAGDESHAIVEASGCVNLMTLHAAKGLEFPIVFLVNLQIPGRGRSGGFTIVERNSDGEPEVAFSSNAATKLEDERDTEELRRLLYVGITRARDRLYLASQMDARHQLIRRGRSIASLLPQSFGTLFADAASNVERNEVTWTTTGGSFTFSVCRPEASERAANESTERSGASGVPASDVVGEPAGAKPLGLELDVEVLEPGGQEITRVAGGPAQPASSVPVSSQAHHRVLGTLVHRLFQLRVDPTAAAADLAQRLATAVPVDDRLEIEDWDALVAEALGRYSAVCARPEYRSLIETGECLFEVPFSHVPAGGPPATAPVVRGVIDCLVLPPAGPATVLEFKTGAARAGHDEQAARYQAAIRAILGKNDVDVKILYV